MLYVTAVALIRRLDITRVLATYAPGRLTLEDEWAAQELWIALDRGELPGRPHYRRRGRTFTQPSNGVPRAD